MRKRQLWLSALALFLLLAGAHPFNLWWFSWLAFIPLFIMIDDAPPQSPRNAVFPTFLIGILYYAYLGYGFASYEFGIFIPALLLAALSFSTYFIFCRLLARRLTSSAFQIGLVPAVWIILQKIYSFTPIGTIAPEIPFYGPLEFLQIAALTGFAFHGALVLGLCASASKILTECKAPNLQADRRKGRILALLFLVLLASSYLWGRHKLRNPLPIRDNIKAALIQHNLPPDPLWRLHHEETIVETYRQLSRKAMENGATLLIFPLYDVGLDVYRHPELSKKLTGGASVHSIFATYIPDRSDHGAVGGFWDMALLFSPTGQLEDSYHAIYPPPFRNIGEKKALHYKILNSPFGRMGIHLCYENGLSRLTKKAARLGAEVHLSLSNPGFFNTTPIPYYHLMQDRLRAIESGQYFLRVSPNGPTAVIDPLGRLVQKTGLDEERILYTTLPLRRETTPFHRNFDWLPAVSLLFLILAVARRKLKGSDPRV